MRPLVLALAIALVSAHSPVASGIPANAAGNSGLATLSVLVESVTVVGAGGSAPAVDGQIVHVGDTLWTGPDGLALLTFFDGSETQIQSNTQITLEVPTGVDPADGVSVFQSAGVTVTHVHHLAPTASFQTDTPGAVAMVRGTTYVVSVMPQSEAAIDEPISTSTAPPEDPAQASTSDNPPSSSASDPAEEAPQATSDRAVDAPTSDPADQQAALTESSPLAMPSAPSTCQRSSPADCLTSVVLLADADGHVGHVEVASHIAGHPTVHLTAHGDAAHISRAGAMRQPLSPEHLNKLHDAALHLTDAQRATRAHMVARHVVRQPLRSHIATPRPHV